MTNERLVKEIQSGNKQRYEQLWKQCEKFVRQQANRWSTYVEFEDLVQQGYIILHDAAADYDPDAGTKFITYLGNRLTWAWPRWIEETGRSIRLPSHMVHQIQQYEKTQREYKQKYGTEAREADLSLAMGIDLKTLHLIQEAAQKSRLRSLNEVIEDEDGSGTELGEQIPDSMDLEAECIERVHNEQLAAVMWPMVDELEDRQSEVIHERYEKNRPLVAIAEERAEPREKTQKDHDAGLRELRKPQRIKKLKPFAQDERMKPMYGTGLTYFKETWESAPEREAMRRWFKGRKT